MNILHSKYHDSKIINLNKEISLRREKLNKIRHEGNAFPNDFRRSTTSNCLHMKYGNKNKKELEKLNIQVSLAGRMITRRIIGRVSFVTLQDIGGKIQLYVSYNHLPEKFYDDKFKTWDLGDILGACGKLFKTNTGELSVSCSEIRLLTKSIRPLPDKFHGLVDQETRYRKRYLDLISNEKSRQIFKIRSKIITEIRNFMIMHDFMEVETPIMQMIPGGASARPFITHHNSLDTDMYLRISPELYLKQLIIGHFEKVFEINKSFRNEGLSPYHNPEFTMMELYMAYSDYRDLIVLVENLLRMLTQQIFNSNMFQYGNYYLDFGKPFIEMTMKEAICYYYSTIQSEDLDKISTAIIIAQSFNIKVNKEWGLGRIQNEIFETIVIHHLIQPTFITTYPVEVSPLARRNDDNSFFAERFELFIGGKEIGNGFSELNDSEDQAKRLFEQIKNKDIKNDDIGMFYDEDYIAALEYGLPPTAGLGIGIDRLVMLFTNSKTIRDVILFPTLRPIQ